MASKKAAAPEALAGAVKVRVLTQCAYGAANDVVTLSAAEAEQGQLDRVTDSTPEAVAYAESLKAAE